MHTYSTWSDDMRVVFGCTPRIFPDHFQTIHICSTWSEDVRVVLGLSIYYIDVKVTTFTNQAMKSGTLVLIGLL